MDVYSILYTPCTGLVLVQHTVYVHSLCVHLCMQAHQHKTSFSTWARHTYYHWKASVHAYVMSTLSHI